MYVLNRLYLEMNMYIQICINKQLGKEIESINLKDRYIRYIYGMVPGETLREKYCYKIIISKKNPLNFS